MKNEYKFSKKVSSFTESFTELSVDGELWYHIPVWFKKTDDKTYEIHNEAPERVKNTMKKMMDGTY